MSKISIIVAVYNTENYLEQCIESIINQEYKNLEIILINDGSTDNSLSICNKYKTKDSRIIVVDKPHTGVADTKNHGLEIATGDFIGFVDSDDYINKDMFKHMIVGIEKYNADISMCDLEETTSRNRFNTTNRVNYIEMSQKEALEQLLYDKNIGNYMTVKLFKKEVFKNIKFPVGRLYEDISIAYKLFKNAEKIVYTPTVMYHYYQRKESIVNNKTRHSITEYLNSIFERYYELKNENLDLYNVYSIVNVVIKMSVWAIKIGDYELYDNDIYNYYCKVKEELPLIREAELVELMTDFEKASFYVLKLDKECLKNLIQHNKSGT